jgi:hypothetical protein
MKKTTVLNEPLFQLYLTHCLIPNEIDYKVKKLLAQSLCD